MRCRYGFLFLVVLLFFPFFLEAQIVPPYHQGFAIDPGSGWSTNHPEWGDLGGDWEYSVSPVYFEKSGWVTNPFGPYRQNTVSRLYSPAFDFSDTTKHYKLSVRFKSHLKNARLVVRAHFKNEQGGNTNIELRRGDSEGSSGWYSSSSGWNSTEEFGGGAVSLGDLAGEDSVYFSFYFTSSTTTSGHNGILLEEVSISEVQGIDIVGGTESELFDLSPNLQEIDIPVPGRLNYDFTIIEWVDLNVYLSDNAELDGADELFFQDSVRLSANGAVKRIPIPEGMAAGNYFLLVQFDPSNKHFEISELNNLGLVPIEITPLYSPPFFVDFENTTEYFQSHGDSSFWFIGGDVDLSSGWGTKPGRTGAHSDSTCLMINSENQANLFTDQSHLQFNGEQNLIQFWYKGWVRMEYQRRDGLWVDFVNTGNQQDDIWKPFTAHLPEGLDTLKSTRIRFESSTDGMMDDLYVGPNKSDLVVIDDDFLRVANFEDPSFKLCFDLYNAGMVPAAPHTLEVYYSDSRTHYNINDKIGEYSIGVLGGLDTIHFEEMVSISAGAEKIGFLHYILDSENNNNEFNEKNNLGFFKLIYTGTMSVGEFYDFEDNSDWNLYNQFGNSVVHFDDFSNSPMQWTGPSGDALIHSEMELSKEGDLSRDYLFSPFISLDGWQNPVIEFDFSSEQVGQYSYGFLDLIHANLSYSFDFGKTWDLVQTTPEGNNRWQSESSISNLFQYDREGYLSTSHYMDYADTACAFAGHIGDLMDKSTVVLRLAIVATQNSVERTLAFDNFTIREGATDLIFLGQDTLFFSGHREDGIGFNLIVQNTGNETIENAQIELYLSQDASLGQDDILMEVTQDLGNIKPFETVPFNVEALSFPETVSNFNYILAEIQVLGNQEETNTSNNLGVYPISTSSFSPPYLETFNSDHLDRWKSAHLEEHYYFNEHKVFKTINSGRNTTVQPQGEERAAVFFPLPPYSGANLPYVYLESPPFDFTNEDSVFLSFSMSSLDAPWYEEEFLTLLYMEEGSSDWNILGTYDGSPDNTQDACNWYNRPETEGNDYTPCWIDCRKPEVVFLNATSWLKGKENVTFRFLAHYERDCGFLGRSIEIDNFRISETRPFLDLVACTQGEHFVINNRDSIPGELVIKNTGNVHSAKFSVNLTLNSPEDGQESFGWEELDFKSLPPGDSIVISLNQFALPSGVCEESYDLHYEIITYTADHWEKKFEGPESNNSGHNQISIPGNSDRFNDVSILRSAYGIQCPGQTVELTAHGEFFFHWTPGDINDTIISVSSTSEHYAHYLDHQGCEHAQKARVLFSQSSYSVNSGILDAQGCEDYGTSLQISPVSDSVVWNNGDTGNEISVFTNGSYFGSAIDENGCWVSFDTVEVLLDSSLTNYLLMVESNDSLVFCNEQKPVLYPNLPIGSSVLWSNGQESDKLAVTDKGPYSYKLINHCGVFYSDTVWVEDSLFVQGSITLDSVLCENHDYEISLEGTNTTNFQWFEVEPQDEYVYIEDFAYPSGTLRDPKIPSTWFLEGDSEGEGVAQVGGERLVFSQIEGEASLHIGPLDISDYQEVSVSLSVQEYLNAHHYWTDTVKSYYSVDYGEFRPFDHNGVLFGDFQEATVEQRGVKGGILEVLVLIHANGASYHNLYINEITVSSTSYLRTDTLQEGESWSLYMDEDRTIMVELTEGGCSAYWTEEAIVNVSDQNQIIAQGSDYFICQGSEVELDAYIDRDFSVRWTPDSINDLNDDREVDFFPDTSLFVFAEGTHPSGCKYYDSIFVEVSPIPEPVIFVENGVIQSEIYGNYDYDWGLNGIPIHDGEDSHILSQSYGSGYYELYLHQNFGYCYRKSEPFLFIDPNAVDCHGELGGLAYIDVCGRCAGGNTGVEPISSVFDCPVGFEELQPTEGYVVPTLADEMAVIVTGSPGSVAWEIHDLLGAKVLDGEGVNIPLAALMPGYYVVHFLGVSQRILVVH